jgi:hypothetical protein
MKNIGQFIGFIALLATGLGLRDTDVFALTLIGSALIGIWCAWLWSMVR